ncbi:hypothetical protein PCANC_25378 [Puccinia coronata f. sp. avenae]|uniref:Uncharacterized protein n=1 Tax=Puccinia coronata f. sp. avenae TaxID=200324 RepID=A0A2N5S1D5_9BASI|nr:hypothetical protein PCANC_25378 [Puccinia coronata f. sp. avenae]
MSSQPSSACPALMVLWSQTKDTGTIIFGLKRMNWVDKPLKWISTTNQLANIFTKALRWHLVLKFLDKTGLRPLSQTLAINLINDSEDDPEPTENDNPDSTQPEPVKSQELTDEQELRRAQKVHKAAISSTYTAYKTPELSNQLDKHGHVEAKSIVPLMTPRQAISPSTWQVAPRNQQTIPNLKHWQLLVSLAWVTLKPGRYHSFAQYGALKELDPFLLLAKRHIGESIMESIKSHRGAVYLGLVAWQSPNGFDVLGTVLYQLVERLNGEFELEASPLDFV